tara:strand:- start:1790 stop:1975 length:186 start_codon:yes stop_codon:yes gene_type:complete
MRFKLIYNKSEQTVTIQDKDDNFSVWNEIVLDTPAQVEIDIEVETDPLENYDYPEGVDNGE